MGRAGVRTKPRSKAHCINYFSVTPSGKCLSHVGLLNKQMFVITFKIPKKKNILTIHQSFYNNKSVYTNTLNEETVNKVILRNVPRRHTLYV